MTSSEALRQVLESDRVDLHTGFPAIVRSFDAAAQTIEAVPAIRRVIPATDDDEADAVEDLPILTSVPVIFPRGGGFRISWPLQEGDEVWIAVSEADLSRWRETGRVSDPGVATRHGLSGAVAIPGIHSRGNANPNATTDTLRIEYLEGPAIEITSAQVRCGGSDALAEHAALDAHLQAILADLATVFAAASAGLPTYNATLRAANPYATSVTRGT